jgi:hypothetical protein
MTIISILEWQMLMQSKTFSTLLASEPQEAFYLEEYLLRL